MTAPRDEASGGTTSGDEAPAGEASGDVPAFPFRDWGFELAPEYAGAGADAARRVTTVTGDLAWLVTRYDLARRILVDPRLSMTAALEPNVPQQEPVPQRAPEGTADIMTTLKESGLHKVIADALGPRAVRLHREWTRERAVRLLDDTVRDGAPADLRAGFSLRLPFTVACRVLLGDLDAAERARLNALADVALSWGPGYSGHAVADLAEAQEEMYRFFLCRVTRLAGAPGDHLVKQVAARGVLDERDLAVLAVSMFIAGYRTASSFLGGAVVTLLRHPEVLRAVRDDPDLVPATVEELLRFTPMATGGAKRLALEDIDLDGLLIRAGDLVLVSLEAANRDPAAFTDPDAFTPGRDAPGHFGFGHGSHYCPGNRLARMQLEAAVVALADRSPALRLAVPAHELRWMEGAAFRMPHAIPVTW
ncbi:cytochrome P450 [Actinomadura harenae]|uniref:Cytochrome P450 n=1 Tax=Actinomadura harenae TaxID=2483351 RepID=A0A3M2LLJ8_9ACTN|nr:cytochrome P450 [Actinomadura harenae]RMI37383.1 cytochrome P450 [Actinomadura harenae]